MTGDHTSHEELWTRETLSVPKGFNLGNFGTGHGKRCQFGKGSIWEILVLGTGNAVSSEKVQSGKFWYWARETLSVRKGFNLGNFRERCIDLDTSAPHISLNHSHEIASCPCCHCTYVWVQATTVDNMSSGTYFATRATGTYICSTREILRTERPVATDLCSDLYCSMRGSTSSSDISSNANLC